MEKKREGEVDRVELRQMSGIDEALSNTDTQAELQQDHPFLFTWFVQYVFVTSNSSTKAVCLDIKVTLPYWHKISTKVETIQSLFTAFFPTIIRIKLNQNKKLKPQISTLIRVNWFILKETTTQPQKCCHIFARMFE